MSGRTPIPDAYRSKTPEQAMAHLAEELAEALTATAKSLRFGFWCHNPELPPAEQETNFVWLRREMKDVARAYAALGAATDGGEFAREMADDLGGHPINADLLEALKTLLDRVDQINMTTSQIQYWADYQALARAAIAKATGNDARPVGESQ